MHATAEHHHISMSLLIENVESVDRKQYAAGMCVIQRNSITVQVFLLPFQKKIKCTHFYE